MNIYLICLLIVIAPIFTGIQAYTLSLPFPTNGGQQSNVVATTNTEPHLTRNAVDSNSCSCGETFTQTTRIIGGSNAAEGEFPWHVHVHPFNRTSYMGVSCGGTLIHPDWVLTAAHCTDFKQGWDIIVTFNSLKNPTTIDGEYETTSVNTFMQHPDYNRITKEHDLSLLRLVKPITDVMPLCLPFDMAKELSEMKNVTISGWGTTEPVPVTEKNNGIGSDVLKKVVLQTMSNEECKKHNKEITGNMLCTYSEGLDACQGDSGGSLDYYNQSNGLWYDVGVVSSGSGCAQKNEPGFNVKLANYLSWIDTHLRGHKSMLCKK